MRSWTEGRPWTSGARGRKVLRPLSCLWLGLLGVGGCGGARAGIEPSSAPTGGRVIMAAAIAKSGAKKAWDDVRVTDPTVQLRAVRGEADRRQRRGPASLHQHPPLTGIQ